MPSTVTTLGDLAQLIRAKNAGPFWITVDVFFHDRTDYNRVTGSTALTAQVIADLYRVDADSVRLFQLPAINVIKASFPRPTTQGSFADRADVMRRRADLPRSRVAPA